RIGSVKRASRSPTISGQERMMSEEAKPWAASAGAMQLSTRSDRCLGDAMQSDAGACAAGTAGYERAMVSALIAPSKTDSTASAAALLAWYDRHRRTLPWRAAPGETPDP